MQGSQAIHDRRSPQEAELSLGGDELFHAGQDRMALSMILFAARLLIFVQQYSPDLSSGLLSMLNVGSLRLWSSIGLP